MPHWVPSSALAFAVAGGLAALSVAVRVWVRRSEVHGGPARPKSAVSALFAWEAAIIIAIYGFWQYAGSLALIQTSNGVERGQGIWDLERTLHLPSEHWVQSLFLPFGWLIQFFNIYYVLAHYNVLLIMLVWLFWRHRDRFREARRVIALTTFACLAVQFIAVAPPRLIDGHGIVDTAIKYGQSVYGPVGQGFSDQYSAMPSVHIAWASSVAFFVWRSTGSRWRWLGVAHWVLTWIVVVATGNHYWLDGLVAMAILAMSFWTVRLITVGTGRVTQWLTWKLSPPTVEPAGLLARASARVSAAVSPLLSRSPQRPAPAQALGRNQAVETSPPSL